MLVEKRTLQYIRMNTFILCNICQMNGHLVSTEVLPDVHVNECSGVVQYISIHTTSCMCALLVAWTIGADMALPCALADAMAVLAGQSAGLLWCECALGHTLVPTRRSHGGIHLWRG